MKPSPSTTAPAPALPPARRRLFRLILLPLVLVVPLGALELGLRLAGYGYETDFLLARTVNGRSVLVDNPKFTHRFFPPRLARAPQTQLIEAEKPANTVRVVVLGESAAMGDPEPSFGLPRQLEVTLAARFPEKRFEVINAAVTAVNSHSFPDMACGVARLNADFWVVYAGNNEFMGPFGPASIGGGAGRPLWLIRAGLALQRLRTGQWLAALAARFRQSGEGLDAEFAGLEQFMSRKLDPQDPVIAAVHRNFRINLEAVLAVAREHGVPVVLAPPVVNLRDSGPFASFGPDLAAPLGEVTQLLASNEVAQAVGRLRELTQQHPQHAGARFLLGRALLAAGDTNAPAEFLRARDLDALRFRADSGLTETVRTLAAAHPDVTLLAETRDAFAAEAEGGVPGSEAFWEHVHFTFAGNHRLALTIAETLETRLGAGTGNWATRAELGRALAYTDWNHARMIDLIRARVSRPPFTTQPLARAREMNLNLEREIYEPALQVTAFERHAGIYRNALEQRPDDWVMRDNFARLLLAFGDPETAAAEWKKVIAAVPHHLLAHFQLGDALSAQATTAAEAEQYLRATLALREDFPEAWDRLGQALGHQKKFPEAEAAFARALKLRPRFTDAQVNLALIAAAAGRTNDTVDRLRAAASTDTNSILAWTQLGRFLAQSGRTVEAAEAHERAAALRPSSFALRYQAGDAWRLAQRPDKAGPHWMAAVKLNPENAEARYYVGVEFARLGEFAAAEHQFREAIRLQPTLASAHLNLGVALIQLKRPQEALVAFDEAARLDPGNPRAAQYLRMARQLLSQGSPP